jgi:hypothetical protein
MEWNREMGRSSKSRVSDQIRNESTKVAPVHGGIPDLFGAISPDEGKPENGAQKRRGRPPRSTPQEASAVAVVQQLTPDFDSPLTGPVRAERYTMEYPFFAVTTGRKKISWSHDNVSVEVLGTENGVASLEDKVWLLYIGSLMRDKLEKGESVDRKFRFKVHDLFRISGRSTSQKSYDLLEVALVRLQGTQVRTNLKTGGKIDTALFSWLKTANFEKKVRRNGTEYITEVTAEVCDWLYRAFIDDSQVLVQHDGYFKLPALERRLFEFCYSMTQDSARVVLPLTELKDRMAVQGELRDFRYKLSTTIESRVLPGFDYRFVRVAGTDEKGIPQYVENTLWSSLDQVYLSISRNSNNRLIDLERLQARKQERHLARKAKASQNQQQEGKAA